MALPLLVGTLCYGDEPLPDSRDPAATQKPVFMGPVLTLRDQQPEYTMFPSFLKQESKVIQMG